MKLYWAPQTRAFSALWMLEEVGQPYERVLVDIRAGAQDSADYRAINPMGKVPALADGEAVVAEQAAICLYLGDRFPEAGLAPAIDDPRRGRYLQWLFFVGNCVEPAYMQKHLGFEAAKSQAGWGSYDHVVDVLEDALRTGPWVLGDRFTAADVMFGCAVYFGLAFGLLDSRPAFTAHSERCTARPAFQRASEIEKAALAE